ncbi:DUF4256 domain-containing protein [Halobacillus salinus]|uniref:DUF4256 domain-containing protein n=1 Tax=Halobacillus salinus TaxID=192814 RepID=A0A4Z0H1Z0_9BACI|nr:DUF4256 domain-containing protein [Halobacillus salinus]TGB03867.1 DUF4256 domain-containing protein [Halobacillus salinus]
MSKVLSEAQREELLHSLQKRFEKNSSRHPHTEWSQVKEKLEAQPEKLWSLHQMEESGGEPDVVGDNQGTSTYLFMDCSKESPKGRRSVCYDREALESRKKYKPENSAMDMAKSLGIDMLTEDQYRMLQEFGEFDKKSSSWIETPADIRERGGALFCDYRYGHVFVYHNGAESYYAARGFRGCLQI